MQSIKLEYSLSKKGKNFDGEDLDENNLKSNEIVMYKNRIYVTGNRKDDIVELYKSGIFICCTTISNLRLIK